MKKIGSSIMVIVLIAAITTTGVMGKSSSLNNYKCKTMSVSGNYSKDISKNSYKKIISSYKQLEKVKKYVKKNYNYSKKYLKKLNKYNKKFFKKNALIFVTENVDVNAKTYTMSSLEKKDDKLLINIDRRNTLKEGQYTTEEIQYCANTYFISVKNLSIKKTKKIKVVYNDVESDNNMQETTK